MTTDYRHPDHMRFAPLWKKVRDACAGEDAIKAEGKLYLPDPSESVSDQSLASYATHRARYDAYLRRAVYYPATGRTLSALTGIAFANWPAIKVPGHKYLLDDVDGSGVGLVNQSQWALSEVLQTGRAGLLADATPLDEIHRIRKISVAKAEALGHRVLIAAYSADSILTWEISNRQLARLVLLETHLDYAGGEVSEVPQLRELVMEDGKCVVHIWRKLSGDKFTLLSSKVTTFKRIPFTFIGATNNDATPDQPPLLDLANMNSAHYRDSADFQESVFLLGQPQMIISGVDNEWSEKVGAVHFGSRVALPLPVGATADLLQAQPNTLAQVAMEKKEAMMAALGARLLDSNQSIKTATQSASEAKSSYSQLSLACDNVSEAYRRTLQEIVSWSFPSLVNGVEFAIDTRFNDLALDSNAIRETVAAWQAGLVPQSDAWGVLRRLGVVDQGKTDGQLRDELDTQGPNLNLDEAA